LGKRIVVREGEPLIQAVRRLKKILSSDKPPFHKRRLEHYLKPSEVRRRKRNNAALVRRRSEARRRRELGLGP